MSETLKGKKHTVEHRRNNSLAHKGKIPWNKDKPWPEETKEKIRQKALHRECSLFTRQKLSEAAKGEKSICWRKFGNLHPAYKHGLTSLYQQIRNISEYKSWCYQTFKRDQFTCQECGSKKSGTLQAHHINPLMEILKSKLIKTISEAIACNELWDVDNGITYCKSCHILKERGCLL